MSGARIDHAELANARDGARFTVAPNGTRSLSFWVIDRKKMFKYAIVVDDLAWRARMWHYDDEQWAVWLEAHGAKLDD